MNEKELDKLMFVIRNMEVNQEKFDQKMKLYWIDGELYWCTVFTLDSESYKQKITMLFRQEKVNI